MSVDAQLILVIEDEVQVRKFIRAALVSHGYRALEAETAAVAMMLLTSHNPSLLLLDLGLPDGDGIAFTRQVREWSRVPIIVLSARGREEDKVAALDAGADDYLSKPFGVNELLARIRVAHRHAISDGGLEQRFSFGDVVVDFVHRDVTRGGVVIHLTPIEYKLLTVLVKHAGKVVSHAHLLREVWGPLALSHTHYVRVHMAELRKKLEADAARPRHFITEPGVGYRLRD